MQGNNRKEEQKLFWGPGDPRPHEDELPHMENFWDLHKWSVDNRADFWSDVWDHFGVIGEKGPGPFVDDSIPINENQSWFPGASFNIEENLLLSHNWARSSEKLAIISKKEAEQAEQNPIETCRLSYAQLYDQVNHAAESLRKLGVGPYDIVATFSVSNVELLITYLAVTSTGAIFTSTPAEFGAQACIDRYLVAKPKVLVTTDAYRYNGKVHNVTEKSETIANALVKAGLKHIIVTGNSSSITGKESVGQSIRFHRGSFSRPLWIVFSSGTTGKPKAILAPSGGVLLARQAINTFHQNADHRDTLLQFASTAWIVYNLSLNFLATGGTLLIYDGSPFRPTGALWSLAEKCRCTLLGTSPRYIQVLSSNGYFVNKHHDFSSLGLIHEQKLAVPFYIVAPHCPYIQNKSRSPALGMDVAAYSDNGQPVIGREGAMVIRKSFPNMPVKLLYDQGGRKYQETYFEDFKTLPSGVWGIAYGLTLKHGERLGHQVNICIREARKATKRMINGFLPAIDLYSVTEKFGSEVENSIAVAKKTLDGDVEVVLFLQMAERVNLDENFRKKLTNAISHDLSTRHVPKFIVACNEVPMTINGKKLESAVRKLINGAPLSSISTVGVSNPDTLKFYAQYGASKAKL